MSLLFARLRAGTERQHREIEGLVSPMQSFASLEAYKAHLVNAWQFHACLEPALATIDWPGLGIDYASRRKTPLLDQDLRALGVSHPSTRAAQRLERSGLNFAMGCLYVLEGATLGGQLISRHLATLGIGPANGGLFFNGYGIRTGDMWKSFQLRAAGHCITDDQIDAAVHGARWTFEQYRDAMTRRTDAADASCVSLSHQVPWQHPRAV